MIMTSLRNLAFGAIASLGALTTAMAQGFTPHVSGEADLGLYGVSVRSLAALARTLPAATPIEGSQASSPRVLMPQLPSPST